MPFGHDGSAYSAAQRDDGTYDVIRVPPHGSPEVVGTFATNAEAQHWIFELVMPRDRSTPNVLI
mgnify:CR=1 FL=1|jgi:hypothetical protein